MQPHQDSRAIEQATDSLSETVLTRLEKDHICPRGRWYFLCGNWLAWGWWLALVVIAALACAVLVFVLSHRHYALYEATHATFFAFLVDIAPFWWVLVAGGAAFYAIMRFRRTPRGYRHSLGVTIASVLIVVSGGGLAFHYFGWGYWVDDVLGREFPRWYASQSAREYRLWNQPTEGRLVGVFQSSGLASSLVVVRDGAGTTWLVDVSELPSAHQAILRTGEQVRIIGYPPGAPGEALRACAVFPWTYRQVPTMKSTRDERARAFDDYHHMRSVGWSRAHSPTRSTTTSELQQSCAEHALFHRMQR
jgi:hypothetical protein